MNVKLLVHYITSRLLKVNVKQKICAGADQIPAGFSRIYSKIFPHYGNNTSVGALLLIYSLTRIIAKNQASANMTGLRYQHEKMEKALAIWTEQYNTNKRGNVCIM